MPRCPNVIVAGSTEAVGGTTHHQNRALSFYRVVLQCQSARNKVPFVLSNTQQPYLNPCTVPLWLPCLSAGADKPYLQLLQEVVARTAYVVAMWQTLGFVHGVLNTDNMSILGLTIDYGPYGFLDK